MINTALFTAMCPRLVTMRLSRVVEIADRRFSSCEVRLPRGRVERGGMEGKTEEADVDQKLSFQIQIILCE